jgi:rRNA maturation endonuclease Nob1
MADKTPTYVQCADCGRLIEGDPGDVCADCKAEARREARRASKED